MPIRHLFGPRWTLAALPALILAGFIRPGVPAGARSSSAATRFEVTQNTLRQATEQAASVLERKIILSINPGHPAHKMRVSLAMPVSDPNDLLKALSAAFGLRWFEGGRPGQVIFVDKRDYQGTAAGLRQAIADALPADLRDFVRPGNPNRSRSMEAGLKMLEEKEAQRLLATSAKGPVALSDADPSLARPLQQFLDAHLAFRLGNTCDLFVDECRKNSTALFHYGPNSRGTVQFSFKVGNRTLAAKPD